MAHLRKLTTGQLYGLARNFYSQELWQPLLTQLKTADDLLGLLEGETLPLSKDCEGDINEEAYALYLASSLSGEQATALKGLSIVLNNKDDEEVNFGLGLYNAMMVKRTITQALSAPTRLVVAPIALMFLGQVGLGHANVLLVDTVAQTVEYFEPHGKFNARPTYTDPSEQLKQLVQEVLASDYPHYRYIAPLDYCPYIGPQKIQAPNRNCREGGYCLVFSALYTHLRLLEPDLPREETVALLTDLGDQKLLEVILRYLYLLTATLPPLRSPSAESFVKLLQTEGDYDPASYRSAVEAELRHRSEVVAFEQRNRSLAPLYEAIRRGDRDWLLGRQVSSGGLRRIAQSWFGNILPRDDRDDLVTALIAESALRDCDYDRLLSLGEELRSLADFYDVYPADDIAEPTPADYAQALFDEYCPYGLILN
jgi:hypothetical protein